MVKHFENLEFTVLVSLVLEDFLDCHSLASLGYGGFEHNTKGAVSDDFFRVVGERLLLHQNTRKLESHI